MPAQALMFAQLTSLFSPDAIARMQSWMVNVSRNNYALTAGTVW